MNSIEKMAKREKKPVRFHPTSHHPISFTNPPPLHNTDASPPVLQVVLLGHSMGNRIIQYFCLWAVKVSISRLPPPSLADRSQSP